MKALLILILIQRVVSSKGDWYQDWNSTSETTTLSPYWKENEQFGCSYTHLYRKGLYGLCFEEPYTVNLCTRCSGIEMTLDQVNIIDIDLKKQILTTKFKYTIAWIDDRIILHNLNRMNSVLATQKKNEFWMPKLTIHQAIDAKSHDGLGPSERLMFKDGIMTYVKTSRFEIACRMNFQDFPFDNQTCPVEVKVD